MPDPNSSVYNQNPNDTAQALLQLLGMAGTGTPVGLNWNSINGGPNASTNPNAPGQTPANNSPTQDPQALARMKSQQQLANLQLGLAGAPVQNPLQTPGAGQGFWNFANSNMGQMPHPPVAPPTIPGGTQLGKPLGTPLSQRPMGPQQQGPPRPGGYGAPPIGGR